MGVPNSEPQGSSLSFSSLSSSRIQSGFCRYYGAIGLFVATAWSLHADAARYLIQLHSPAMHRQIAAKLDQKPSNGGLRSAFFNIPVPQAHSVRVAELGVNVQEAQRAGRLLTVEVANRDELQMIQSNPNIAMFEREEFFRAPDPVAAYQGPQVWRSVLGEYKEIPWGLKAIKAVEAWNINQAQPIMGQNTRVLVLDTGIDKNHDDLVERFEKGKNFMEKGPFERQDVGDGEFELLDFGFDGRQGEFWEADFFENDYDYFDTNGHGTHVSGTIAATLNERGVVGVAPAARILSGRVCGGRGCSSIGIVQGIYWGIEEKVDVINMSLGGARPSPATAEAVRAADQAGVVVVAASGNDGKLGVSYPAAHPESIAVGAVNPFLQRASFSNWGPELDVMAPGVDVLSSVPRKMGRLSQVQIIANGGSDVIQSLSFKGSLESPTPIQAGLVNCGLGKPGECPLGQSSGKIALIGRGEIKFTEKVLNAVQAGVVGVLIYNNSDEGPSAGMLESEVKIPVAGITQAAGQKLLQAINGGHSVQASIAVLPSDYQSFAGTSMATPHVAGLVALMKSANKTLKGADVRAILARTSRKVEAKDPLEVANGLVDAEAAVREAIAFKPGPAWHQQELFPAEPPRKQLEFDFGRP